MKRLEWETVLDFLRGFAFGFGSLIPSSTIPCRTPKVVAFSFSPGLGSDVHGCVHVLIHLCVQGKAVAAVCSEFGRWNSLLVTVNCFGSIYGQIRYMLRAPKCYCNKPQWNTLTLCMSKKANSCFSRDCEGSEICTASMALKSGCTVQKRNWTRLVKILTFLNFCCLFLLIPPLSHPLWNYWVGRGKSALHQSVNLKIG